jgi:N6-adenosine-specific RNA methylase IME4
MAALRARLVPLEQLKKLDVPSIAAPDSLLFLWTSSPHLEQAMALIRAWGFEYKTVAFVWEKKKSNPGYYTMSECELCLVAKKLGGDIPKPRGDRNVRQFLSEMRGQHSAKPAEIRNRITKMFPSQRKLELFARTKTSGWSVWGDEVEGGIEIAWKA